MKRKRGQLLAEPFVWIMALVVASIVLLFGYMVIGRLNSTFSCVSVKTFVQDINKDINEIYYMDSGSFKLSAVSLPDNIKGVCFYGGSGSLNNNLLSPEDQQIIKLLTDKNLFLLPLTSESKCEMAYKIDSLKINGLTCFGKRDKIKLVANKDKVIVARQ